MGKLQGKVAVITGANSGIGPAAVHLFVNEGATVLLTHRRQRDLNARVDFIGKGAIGVRSDVSNLPNLDRLFAKVKDAAGAIDVLFANAGGGTLAPLGAISEDQYKSIFVTNVKGTLFTA